MRDKTILVTGFGPFGVHGVNTSWQAVQLLDELQFDGYKLIKHEVPVTYEYVNENIPRLWEEHKPHFVVHVGVNARVTAITIESIARRSCYKKADASRTYHPTGETCPAEIGPDVHTTLIDVARIVAELDTDNLRFVKSTDAGLFLCEYTFYTSLNIDNSRTLFVHVPVMNEPYAVCELARGLIMIIHAALKQICEKQTPIMDHDDNAVLTRDVGK